jgi:site-specific DNA recombinase
MGVIEYERWGVSNVVGKHKPIISKDVFQINQNRLKDRGYKKTTRVSLNPEFPLRGLVRCAYCNEKLRSYSAKSKTGKLHPYYECKNKTCPMRYKAIKAQDIKDEFKAIVGRYTPKKELVEYTRYLLDDL